MCRLDTVPGRQRGGITSIVASYGIIMGLLYIPRLLALLIVVMGFPPLFFRMTRWIITIV